MATVQDCTNNINKYNALKDSINIIIKHLNNASDYSFKAKNQLDGVCTINDSNTKIYSRTKSLTENISSTSNYLKNKVLPAIDNAIMGLNNQIEAIQAEERRIAEENARKERERQEQLRRQQILAQQQAEEERQRKEAEEAAKAAQAAQAQKSQTNQTTTKSNKKKNSSKTDFRLERTR